MGELRSAVFSALTASISVVVFVSVGCSGDAGEPETTLPEVASSSAASETESGGTVLTFGLRENDPGLAREVTHRLSAWFLEQGLPAPGVTAEVLCPRTDLEPGTTACFDARLLLPVIPERAIDLLGDILAGDRIAEALMADEDLSTKLTYAESRGFAWGDSMALLFALRAALNVPQSRGVSAAAKLGPAPPGRSLRTAESAQTTGDTDPWNGLTYDEIGALAEGALNGAYDRAATIPFYLYPTCTSTLEEIHFCGNLSAEGEYSTSWWDDGCSATCKAYYDSCKASRDACKVACCYGCKWGKTCSCNYDCDDERDACERGCSNVLTGSVELDVLNAQNLDKAYFYNPDVGPTKDSASLRLNIGVKLPGGAESDVFWKLCQSGLCVKDTSPIHSSTVEVTAACTVYTEACEETADTALYVTIDNFDLIEPGIWGIEDFADIITGSIDSSMDWLIPNIDDLFASDLYYNYTDVMEVLLVEVEKILNGILVGMPIVNCPKPPDDEADPPAEPQESGREYVSESPTQCESVRIVCDAGMVPFSDSSGCGCEPA